MNKELLIQSATIVNDGCEEVGSILIRNGRIAQVSAAPLPTQGAEVIDARGLLCLPGVIDDQVHFREPGLTHKGDIESESKAAILGGTTSFMEMPNTIPQTTTIEAWEDKMRLGSKRSYANYSFFFGATNDNAPLLQKIDPSRTPGVKVFMGSSTGDMLVDRPETLRRIFAEAPTLVAIHSESESIIRANKEKYTALYGPDPDVKYHPLIRSREACIASTEQAIDLAHACGTKLHVLHLSTAEEVELIAQAGEQVTGEVCVHHLWFDESDYQRLGTRVKWNPAVKTARDRTALREAVRDGKVDVIGTDHAPHLLSEKEGGALRAASGGPLVQHALVMMLELAQLGAFARTQVVDYMCHRPAKLFGVQQRGYIREGYHADLVLVRPDSPWRISRENIAYKCGWSPLEGTTLHHRIETTILNGEVVVREGALTGIRSAHPLSFKHEE